MLPLLGVNITLETNDGKKIEVDSDVLKLSKTLYELMEDLGGVQPGMNIPLTMVNLNKDDLSLLVHFLNTVPEQLRTEFVNRRENNQLDSEINSQLAVLFKSRIMTYYGNNLNIHSLYKLMYLADYFDINPLKTLSAGMLLEWLAHNGAEWVKGLKNSQKQKVFLDILQYLEQRYSPSLFLFKKYYLTKFITEKKYEPSKKVIGGCFSSEGRYLAVITSEDDTKKIIIRDKQKEFHGGVSIPCQGVLPNHQIGAMSFTPDNRHLIIVYQGKDVPFLIQIYANSLETKSNYYLNVSTPLNGTTFRDLWIKQIMILHDVLYVLAFVDGDALVLNWNYTFLQETNLIEKINSHQLAVPNAAKEYKICCYSFAFQGLEGASYTAYLSPLVSKRTPGEIMIDVYHPAQMQITYKQNPSTAPTAHNFNLNVLNEIYRRFDHSEPYKNNWRHAITTRGRVALGWALDAGKIVPYLALDTDANEVCIYRMALKDSKLTALDLMDSFKPLPEISSGFFIEDKYSPFMKNPFFLNGLNKVGLPLRSRFIIYDFEAKKPIFEKSNCCVLDYKDTLVLAVGEEKGYSLLFIPEKVNHLKDFFTLPKLKSSDKEAPLKKQKTA